MPNTPSYLISPLTAEFRIDADERCFRRRVAKAEARQAANGLLTCALFFVAMSYTDLTALGPTPVFFMLLGARTTASLLGVGLAMAVPRWPQLVSNGLAVSAIELVALTAFFAMVLARPNEADLHGMGMLIILLACYLFVPNRLIYMVAICAAATALFLFLLVNTMHVDATTLSTLSMLLLLANSFGALSAYRLSFMRREEFRLLESERDANRLLEREINERRRLQAELSQLVRRDSLTGLVTRRYYLELSEVALKRANRFQKKLSVIFLDLDKFKQINDNYGHSAGDEALRTIAEQCRRTLRSMDIAGRFGGDEFAITLPRTDIDQAMQIADRLRHNLSAVRVPCSNGTFGFTVSLGVADSDGTGSTIDSVLHMADKALYESKQQGRNQATAAARSDLKIVNTSSM